nr:MAG TPA: hypothetical protein [Caudoviricetes sp.]
MKIEKEYNVQELANKVKEKIEKCRNCGTKHVGIDIIMAQEIVDVLEVVASWENKRTKLTDISDEESKGCCFGWHINGDKKCNLCVYERECMIEAKEREKCFGKSYGKRPIIVCGTCKYRKKCEELTKHE